MTTSPVEATSVRHAKASLFHALHRRVLVLPNAWDAMSARLVEDAGATAVATTSAGVAWSLGVADGDRLDRERAVDLVRRVATAVDVPVTADIESGYAEDPAGVATTVEGVLVAGAAGVNIEDGVPGSLRRIEEQAERISAARRAADTAAVPLFVNARVDTYLRAAGDPAARLEETLTRAAAYVAAGADGIFVPGVTDPRTVSALVEGVSVPLNVMAGPGAPDVAALGVARISLGSSIAQAAYAVVRLAAREALTTGTYTTLAGGLDYPELNGLVRG